jgi:hypothetical protein
MLNSLTQYSRRDPALHQQTGRLISHFAEGLEAHGMNTAFRGRGVLVEAYVRTRWSWGKQMLGATLARGQKRIRSMWLMLSSRGVLFIGYVGSRPSLRAYFSHAYNGCNLPSTHFALELKPAWLGQFMPEKFDRSHGFDVNIIEVSPDQVAWAFKTIDFSSVMEVVFGGRRSNLRTKVKTR